MKEIEIRVYDKREKSTGNLYVEQLSENKFRMTDNDIFNCRLTKGTEFETRINKEGLHKIVKIIKDSDYRVLGDELTKHDGFWQVDFGGIATVNIPKDFEFNIDEVMKELDLNLTEITD